MCFSASASFVASGILGAVGVASLKTAKSKSQIPLATIPVLFAVQQLTEGFLWLSLTNSGYAGLEASSTYIFLFFAQVVWPFLVPFAMFYLEKDKFRKKVLGYLTLFGAAVSIYLALCITFYPITGSVSANHISYEIHYPQAQWWFFGVFYFVPTVFPALISSVKGMRLFGLTILISFIVTKVFFSEHVVSVWCYFAAILSAIILVILRNLVKKG
jgi:hypothetical protein